MSQSPQTPNTTPPAELCDQSSASEASVVVHIAQQDIFATDSRADIAQQDMMAKARRTAQQGAEGAAAGLLEGVRSEG